VAVAAGVPRFQGAARRLLVEPQRTNHVRNPRAEGAVAGSPGAAPTGWNLGQPAGVAREVLGVFMVDGVPCLRVRFSGAPATSGVCSIGFENTGASGLAAGTTLAQSVHVRLVAGTMADANFRHFGHIRDGLNAVVVDSQPLVSPPVAGALSRRWRTHTVLNAGTGPWSQAQAALLIYVTAGVPVDFTLDVGGGQLEVGPVPSSLVLPPAGTPAASTRAADAATAALGPWFRQGEGTLLVRAVLPRGADGGVQGLASLDDGTAANRVALRNGAANAVDAQLVAGGAVTATAAAGSMAPGAPFAFAASWSSAGVAACLDGGAVAERAGAVPGGLTALRIGRSEPVAGLADGEIGSLDYWPSRLPVAALRALTATAA
jgi:hypothetical protein